MLKNLKKVAAIVLSFAMAVQFGLADSYYVNAVEEPVEPQQQEEDAPAAEETNEQSAPETKSVELSYVAEDGTVLHETASRDFNLDYSLKTDSSVMLNFDGYTLKDVIINNSQTVPADQANLSVTSDLVSVKFVYVSVNTKEDKQTSENNEQTKTEEANEDDAEADPETKEELPEYPAFDQSETAGNVVVHATAAEGVLPRDSKLVVKRITRKAILNAVEDTVSEKNKEMDSAVALDITIQNKDGVEIQPNGSVNISFENAAVSGDEINIYHVTDDASAVTEVATNTQSFDANHFSIYVITGENDVQLTTFNFVDANGKPVSTQIVKSGDTLIAPTAPDVAGKAFVGWVDEAGNPFTGFGKQAEITETTTRTITAKYENALYVYFYNPEGTQIMRTEKVGDHYPHSYSHVSYDVDSTHKLVGWAAERKGTENIADRISVRADQTSVNVYAIIKEGHWVTFDSYGGSAIDSQFVLHGDKLVLGEDTTPTKPGYTFDGWYNGSTKIETGATVTSSMTLTAQWKAAQVNYTVIHWWENADDDGYSFHESQKLQGLTGETTEAVAKSYTVDGKNIFGESVNDKVFNATTIEQKIIKGDGSTIVNVYYKRKTYTMHFKESWYPYNDLSTITKKWGQSISKNEWPTYYGNGNWKISSSKYLAYTSTMPMEDSKLWSTNGDYTYNAYYYVQKVDGNDYDLHHTDTIKMDSNPKIGDEDCYAIAGFTYSHGDPGVGGYYKNAKFYYTRNSYDLIFINNGEHEKTVSKKYEQSISSENYTPTRPSSLPDYYEFDGWYDNQLCEGEKYVFNGKTMPAQNVTLYAKWTAKEIKLTYNLNNPEGDVVMGSKNVEAGTIANTVLPSASAIEGYSFAGWYVADEGHMTTKVFNANDAITKDTSVIGKWLYNGKLTVVYDPGTEKSKATVPMDSNIYAGGAKVTVAKNATTTSNKKFLGWKLKESLYYPGDAFEVNKNLANDDNVITLIAVWGNEESSTTMSYNPGNGRGDVKTVPVKNNESVTLKSEKYWGYQAPEAEGKEYYFAGWATSMEDAKNGKATYAAGQTVHVDVKGENVLYATWIEKTVIILVANSNTVTYNGEKQEVNGFQPLTIDGYTVSGLNAHAQGTDAGTYPTIIEGTAKVTKGGKDVTEKVVVNVVPGQLTISKRNVTLTSASDSKVYDKKALTNNKVTVSGDGFVKDEGATYDVTGSQTETGSSKNTFTYTLNEGTNADNYEITKAEGTLKVTPITDQVTVTITGNAGSVTYDGNSHKVTGYTTSFSNALYTANDFEFSGKAEASRTNAGQTNMGLAAEQFINVSANFTNVKFVVTDGYSKVNKRKVTLTSASDSKVYDKKALTNNKVTVSGDGFVKDEGATYDVTGSQTETGSSKNTFTYTLNEGTNADNYEITKAEGTLKVTPVTDKVVVEIKGETKTETYNGNTHEVEGYDVTKVSNALYPEEAIHFEGAAMASRKEEGTSYMGLNVSQFSNTSANFINVTFRVTDGWLKVTPKSITPDGPNTPEDEKTGITVTDPADSIYDGKAHVNPLTVRDTKTGKDLVENKDYTLTYVGDVVNVGTVKIEVKGIGNYTGEFTKKYQITPREYTVTTDSANKTYDGTVLTAGGHVNGLVEGETVSFKTTGSQINEGTSDNTYELKFEGTAVETNYKHGKDSIGKLKVTKKSIVPDGPDTPDEKKTGITVSEPSDSKYDGKEHKEVLTVTDTKTGKELVAGTDYSVTYSSDLVNAGTVTMKVAGLGNYTGSFTKTYKITKRSVTLTSATVSKVYDGSALTNTSITVSGDGFVEGEGASYEVTGTQTEVGNSANAFEYKLNEKTLASNYNITKVVGTLTITAAPAPVTPTTPSTPSTPSSTTSTTPRTLSAPQVTTPAETVEKETTPKAEPKKEEKVEEEYTPKASPRYYWALINLICAILTVLFGLLLLISKRHKDEDDDEEDDETKQQTTNDDEEKEQEKKRGLFTRVLAVLIAIVSVVFFLVTEDLSLPWTWTDQWTIWMVVIGLVQIVVFFVGRKWKNVDNDDEDEKAQQA